MNTRSTDPLAGRGQVARILVETLDGPDSHVLDVMPSPYRDDVTITRDKDDDGSALTINIRFDARGTRTSRTLYRISNNTTASVTGIDDTPNTSLIAALRGMVDVEEIARTMHVDDLRNGYASAEWDALDPDTRVWYRSNARAMAEWLRTKLTDHLNSDEDESR